MSEETIRCVVCGKDCGSPGAHQWWCAGRDGKNQAELLDEQEAHVREHAGALRLEANATYGKNKKRRA